MHKTPPIRRRKLPFSTDLGPQWHRVSERSIGNGYSMHDLHVWMACPVYDTVFHAEALCTCGLLPLISHLLMGEFGLDRCIETARRTRHDGTLLAFPPVTVLDIKIWQQVLFAYVAGLNCAYKLSLHPHVQTHLSRCVLNFFSL